MALELERGDDEAPEEEPEEADEAVEEADDMFSTDRSGTFILLLPCLPADW